MSKLTAVAVRNAKPQKKPSKLSDEKELHLHIAPTGLKSWRYRFRVDGKESTFVLGEYPTMSLQDARTARTNARGLVKTGKNPAHENQKAKQVKENSFEKNSLRLD